MAMKFVHLMKNEKFANGIVCFYSTFFNNGEHEIIYFLRDKKESCIREQYSIKQTEFCTQDSKIGVVAYLKSLRCDYIFLHSLFFTSKEKVQLLLDKELLKKLVWIEWGADLYSWKQAGGIKAKIRNYINYRFRSAVKNIICIFPKDIEYYESQFPKALATLYYAPYNGLPVDEEFLNYKDESRLESLVKNKEAVYIQIGQNSLSTLNHIKVLKSLEKFRDENIRIILPLSYGGTKEYADEVIDFAEKEFPGKVIALREFVPEEEYFKLIEKVGIAIFDTDRQCALGNIERLVFRNVKVFLSENGVMYRYFSDLGVPVQKCESIDKLSFKEFIERPPIKNKENFMNYIKSLSCIDQTVEKWTYIYESLRHSMNEN